MELFSLMGFLLGAGLAVTGILAVLWMWAALALAKRADEMFRIQKQGMDENRTPDY
jgi:uncharacterized membrane protein YhiD involved in acid resistance